MTSQKRLLIQTQFLLLLLSGIINEDEDPFENCDI